MRETNYRGIPVQVVQERVKSRKADLHYYEIRYAPDAWATPATIEEKVAVNFWGTLISPQKLDFAGDDYVELSDAEMSAFRVSAPVEEEEQAGAGG